MADGSRLVVHIGLPKCASTYIQRVLEENQLQLLDEGILVKDGFSFGAHWKLAACSCLGPSQRYFTDVLRVSSPAKYSEFKGGIEAEISAFRSESQYYHTTVVSSESLYGACSNYQSIALLHSALFERFSRVDLLYCYRDIFSLAQSLYGQWVTGPHLGYAAPEVFLSDMQNRSLLAVVDNLSTWRDSGLFSTIYSVRTGSSGLAGEQLGRKILEIIGFQGDASELDLSFEENKSQSNFKLSLIRKRNYAYRLVFGEKARYESLLRKLSTKLIKAIPDRVAKDHFALSGNDREWLLEENARLSIFSSSEAVECAG